MRRRLDPFNRCSILALAVLSVSAAPASGASWRGLAITEESRCAPYSANDYRYSASVENGIVDRLGGVYSPYTGEWFASQTETDIEHIVARSEAHDSGLCSATAERKREFASDPLNLTLAVPYLNRWEKSGKDAGEWMPESNRCWFAHTVVAVKRKHGLTVDVVEAAALERVLRRCPSVEMQISPRPAAF